MKMMRDFRNECAKLRIPNPITVCVLMFEKVAIWKKVILVIMKYKQVSIKYLLVSDQYSVFK